MRRNEYAKKMLKQKREMIEESNYNHWQKDVYLTYRKRDNYFLMIDGNGVKVAFDKPVNTHPHRKSIDRAYPLFWDYVQNLKNQIEEEE